MMARYFYTPGHLSVIEEITNNCMQCRSLRPLPRQLVEDTTTPLDTLGVKFSVDVMERFGQKYLSAEKTCPSIRSYGC